MSAVPYRGRPEKAPSRIVSLVPSLTECLFALGLGDRVVGVTEWCIHPASGVASLPKLGGTKNPDVAGIVALGPDLVLANQEENRKRDVERLEEAGIPVWVTYPRTVREGAGLLDALAALGADGPTRERVVAPVLSCVSDAEAASAARSAEPSRVFCPIWRDPWMLVGADTYTYDLLTLCGGAPVLADTGDRRYPRVALEAIVAAHPDVIVLPDEPYAFGPRDVAELQALPIPAAEQGRIHLIDGTLVSWYGPRIHRAVDTLRALLRA
jgi:ABC-type hemin transport system substrate-binding protein